ncbi:MAG: arginine decarboxylase, partial [Pseudobutyrivibrio sp.]|nr:arginine decarboxylase [Pseudobutyrivibrio sp.]
DKAQGEICQDSICLYPPGSPIIVPGERITKGAIEMIQQAKATGIHVTGINNGCISIVN